MNKIHVLALLLAVTACTGALAVGAGCLTYKKHRSDMPTLGTDPLSEWVAVVDNAMSGACG